MKLESLLNIKELEQLVQDRFVGIQRHPSLPLRIFNYTPHAQFENKWGGTIDFCRGLIVDDNDNIVARPFKKFHNLQTTNIPETREENLPSVPPEITKKYDGSLGVYWKYDEQFGVATRGSFTSPQAQWATKWIQEKCPRGFVDDLSGSATPLFEIIYPENRIVVKYDWEGLVLIGLVSIHSGYEYNWITLLKHAQYNGIRLTECIKENLEILKKKNIENEEGYVLTYRRGPASPPLKVKVKMADYLRLHKIVTGMNARSVWELLSSGTGTAGFEHTPEHFQKWLASWSEKLNREFNEIFVESRQIFANRPPPCGWTESIVNDRAYRAVFAEYLRQNVAPAFHGVLFAMLDGKDPAPIIWKQIKPRGDDATFRTEGE
jgi:RNA ligase